MTDFIKLLLTGSSLLPTQSSSDTRGSGLLASFTSPNGILSSGKNGNSSTSRKSFFKSLLSAIVNKALDQNQHNLTTKVSSSHDELLYDEADETATATQSSSLSLSRIPSVISQKLQQKFGNLSSTSLQLLQPAQKKPFYTSSWLKLYKGNATATADKMIDAAVGAVRKSLLLHEDDEQCSRTVNYPQFDRYMCIVAACVLLVLISVQWIVFRRKKRALSKAKHSNDEKFLAATEESEKTWPPLWWRTFSRVCRVSLVWPVDLRRTSLRLPYTLAFVYSSFSVFRVLSSKHPIDKNEILFTDNAPNIFDLPISAAIPHYMRTTFVVINVIVLAFKYSPLFLCVEYEALPALGTFIGLLYTSVLVSVDTLALVKPCVEFTVMNNFENPFFLDYMLFFAPILVASWCLLLWYVCIWCATCKSFVVQRWNRSSSKVSPWNGRKVGSLDNIYTKNAKRRLNLHEKPHMLYASEVAYTRNLFSKNYNNPLSTRRLSHHANLLEQWPIRTFKLDKLFYACKTRPLVMGLLIFLYKWIITGWLLYKPHQHFRFSLRFLASIIIACVLVYAVATALFLSLYHTFSDVWPVVLDKQFQQQLLNLTDQNLVDYLTSPRDANNHIEQSILQAYRPTQLLSGHRALNVTERHQALVGDVRELFVGVSVVMRSLVPKYWQPLTAQLHEILRTQIEVVAWVALLTWTMVSCSFVFIVFDLCAHHRRNMLCAYRGDYSRFRCYRNVNRMTTMAGSIRYMGYQTAYLLWSFIIQLGCAFAVLLVLAELIVLPVVYDYWRITNFIVNTIVPLMLVTCFLWYLMLAVSPIFIRNMYNKGNNTADNKSGREECLQQQQQHQRRRQYSVVVDAARDNSSYSSADDESPHPSRRASSESGSSTISSVLAFKTTSFNQTHVQFAEEKKPAEKSLSNDSRHIDADDPHTIVNRIRSSKLRTTTGSLSSKNNNAILHNNERNDNGDNDCNDEVIKKFGQRIQIFTKNNAAASRCGSTYKNEMAKVSLDNLRAYHIFAYYMFFSNAVIGLGSCFLRICKFSFLGLFYLGRLDRSSLPKNFEFIDKGHLSYVSFMKIEATYTHPVMLAFVSLLERQQRERFYAFNASDEQLEQQQQQLQQQTTNANISLNDDKERQCTLTTTPTTTSSTQNSRNLVDDAPTLHDNNNNNNDNNTATSRFHLSQSACSSRTVSLVSIVSSSTPTNVPWLPVTPLPTALNFTRNIAPTKTILELQKKQRTRTRWLLAYTLFMNPTLTALRKARLDVVNNNNSTEYDFWRRTYATPLSFDIAEREFSFVDVARIKQVSTQATLVSDVDVEEDGETGISV